LAVVANALAHRLHELFVTHLAEAVGMLREVARRRPARIAAEDGTAGEVRAMAADADRRQVLAEFCGRLRRGRARRVRALMLDHGRRQLQFSCREQEFAKRPERGRRDGVVNRRLRSNVRDHVGQFLVRHELEVF